MELSINKFVEDTQATLFVSGEVDVSNADELREALDTALEQDNAQLFVNLSEVSYIDSTGIGVLVGAAHRAKECGGSLTVTQAQKNVARVFKLLDLDEELGLVETLDE